MKTVAIIQARLGSTRLPGKMMYPLDGVSVLSHIIDRVGCAESVDEIIVATSTRDYDSILTNEAARSGVSAFRGSESDVLKRTHGAAVDADADTVVRVCGDDPLLSPECIDTAVAHIREENTDYASNTIDRTFPLGLDVEAFTMESFSRVESGADTPAHREHVTVYYRENPSTFALHNIDVEEVYLETPIMNDPDLRLTLDTESDYQLFENIYDQLPRTDKGIIDVVSAVQYIRENDLSGINEYIQQKDPHTSDE